MSNPTPKDDEDPPVVIIINPKSAFRRALERASRTPAIWLSAIVVIVVVVLVLDR